MTFDIETGNIRLKAYGENAYIERGGKKIKISEDDNGGPKLKNGDKIVAGKKSFVELSTNYNRGKDKPVEDWKYRASKSIQMAPDSELTVYGLEEWDRTDKEKKRYYGEFIKDIELIKGLFSVSYYNNDDALITPVAGIKITTNGGGTLDVYGDILYSNVKGEYTNQVTKKSYTAKSDVAIEIVVTRDAIYKKGMLHLDELFTSMNGLAINSYFMSRVQKSIPEMDEKAIMDQQKNLPKTMEQALGAFEMYKKMSPEDMERMVKIGEKHGAKVTPEMMKQMKEIPEAMKMMEKSGYAEQMKKAMAMSKGMMSGLGDAGMERLVKVQAKGMKKMKEMGDNPMKAFTAEGKPMDVEALMTNPRKYPPLTDAKKVA